LKSSRLGADRACAGRRNPITGETLYIDGGYHIMD
jgi:enoyl-[acyl-carrier-protein] reductase (NADH)